MAIVDLRGRESEPDVIGLLADAQIHRDRSDALERGPAIAREYTGDGNLRLWGYETSSGIAGVIGLEVGSEGRAIVRDLAVRQEDRRHGIGRQLLDFARSTLGMTALEGDTLIPAVAFYERCGFAVQQDGTMPNGDVRYRFSWRR